MKVIFIPFNSKTLIYVALIIVLVVILLFSLLNMDNVKGVFNARAPKPIYKGDESRPNIAFACNVVWGTEYIPPMLELFQDKGVKITFFIGGEWAYDNPDLLREMLSQGHELGNHGYYHKHHSQLGIDENRNEIIKTEQVVHDITGIKTKLFAPPYGEFNDITLEAAHSLDYKTIMWSIDTIDWRREGAQIIANRVLKDPHNGAIILMHPVEDTIEALPTIIDQLTEKGFRIGKVTEVLN
ncbi:MAG TPA: polysaccharide deacetylase family protein [Clostridia bacterium]|nr:polysaccharide deacetylase family protein [Clostridia bacterium]